MYFYICYMYMYFFPLLKRVLICFDIKFELHSFDKIVVIQVHYDLPLSYCLLSYSIIVCAFNYLSFTIANTPLYQCTTLEAVLVWDRTRAVYINEGVISYIQRISMYKGL